MKYPKMPAELDRRIKILPSEHEKIRQWYIENHNVAEIARHYKVAHKTIYCIVHPDFAKQENERKKLWNKNKWFSDEEYRKKQRLGHYEQRRYAIKVKPGELEYAKLASRKFMALHPGYMKPYTKRRWEKIKNSPELLEKARKATKEWYRLNK